MSAIAIVFSSRYGQTRKIAQRIGGELRDLGHDIDTYNGAERFPHSLKGYDIVILGGPVYVGKMPKELEEWAKAYADELRRKDVALFSVSLSAADRRPAVHATDWKVLEDFCARAGLRTRVRRALKGTLPYTRYGFFTRWLMRRLSGSAGGPTDTSRDHEMTDWDEVATFARACVGVPETAARERSNPMA